MDEMSAREVIGEGRAEDRRDRLLRWALLILAVVAGGIGLSRWGALADTLWWYPESNAYQLYVIALAGLVVFSRLSLRSRALPDYLIGGSWAVVLALSLAGAVLLSLHILGGRTGGDLLQGYLEGARRVASGRPVYDLAGLEEGVNASPVVLALLVPAAGLSDRSAIALMLGINIMALVGAWVGILFFVRRLRGRLGLDDLGLVLAAIMLFFSFQRSWRLGQIDTLLLALLAWAIALSESRRDGGALGAGALMGVATSFKLLPGLAVAPSILSALRGPARSSRLRVVGFGVTCCLMFSFSALVLGAAPLADFIRNVSRVGRGAVTANNYAVSTRIALWGHPELREGHAELTPKQVNLGRAISALTLLGLVWLTRRFSRAAPSLRSSLWLTSVPLVSPVCWDIYLLWSSLLPWLVLWGHLTARSRRHRGSLGGEHVAGASATPSPATLRELLLKVGLGGAYLLAGTSGNNTYTDLRTHVSVLLPLPLWLEELPLLGHLLLVVGLLVSLARSHAEALASWEEQEHVRAKNSGSAPT